LKNTFWKIQRIGVRINYTVEYERVKSTHSREPGYMKLTYFIGRAAWRIHQDIVHPLFITVFTISVLYGIMKLAGLSVEIFRHGELLLRIR
jgi:hypothetical protein